MIDEKLKEDMSAEILEQYVAEIPDAYTADSLLQCMVNGVDPGLEFWKPFEEWDTRFLALHIIAVIDVATYAVDVYLETPGEYETLYYLAQDGEDGKGGLDYYIDKDDGTFFIFTEQEGLDFLNADSMEEAAVNGVYFVNADEEIEEEDQVGAAND